MMNGGLNKRSRRVLVSGPGPGPSAAFWWNARFEVVPQKAPVDVQGTTPDRLGLKSGLIVRAVAYVVLPLIALFAVGFPEAGGSLLGWIEPLRQTLPLLQ
jgi:hypothetical protein